LRPTRVEAKTAAAPPSATVVACTVLSTLTSAYVIAINGLYGWASWSAVTLSMNALSAYLALDTVLLFKRYWSRDRMILLHHVGTLQWILFGRALIAHDYPDDVRRFVYWVLLAEVSTVVNGVRLLARGSPYQRVTERVFAAVFLGCRAPMTCGMVRALLGNTYVWYFAPFATVITAANVYWGALIVDKMCWRSRGGSGGW